MEPTGEAEDDVEIVVRQHLQDVLQIPADRIRVCDRVVEDLKADGDALSFLFIPGVEAAVGVTLSYEEWERVHTVQDVVDALRAARQQRDLAGGEPPCHPAGALAAPGPSPTPRGGAAARPARALGEIATAQPWWFGVGLFGILAGAAHMVSTLWTVLRGSASHRSATGLVALALVSAFVTAAWRAMLRPRSAGRR